MSTRYECDCGAVYAHHDLMIECATRNHGRPDQRRLCGCRLKGQEKTPLAHQKFCMLFANHGGDCAPTNPELILLQNNKGVV